MRRTYIHLISFSHQDRVHNLLLTSYNPDISLLINTYQCFHSRSLHVKCALDLAFLQDVFNLVVVSSRNSALTNLPAHTPLILFNYSPLRLKTSGDILVTITFVIIDLLISGGLHLVAHNVYNVCICFIICTLNITQQASFWSMKHLIKGKLQLILKITHLPVLNYGAQTWSLTKRQTFAFGGVSGALCLLGIKLSDRVPNSILCSKTQNP